MEPIDIASLEQQFRLKYVEITIYDGEGNDQPPSVRKLIKKVQLCPDRTHLRFYFDDINFLAVPVVAEITRTAESFTAKDAESGLTYTFGL